jgi:hypothetical protein
MSSAATRKRIQRKMSRHDRVSLEDQYKNGTLAPFIGWDSEGYDAFVVDNAGNISVDHRTMLFGCSADREHPLRGVNLSSLQMLWYLVDIKQRFPKSKHVIFYGDYDVNQLLKDLRPRALIQLAERGSCSYKDFIIEYIPKKILIIIPPKGSGCPRITIEDIWSFCNSSYVSALKEHNIGSAQELKVIGEGKSERGRFNWSDIDYVHRYWSYEIGLLPKLAESIRDTCYASGFYVTKWYGPGAIAKHWLRMHGSEQYMSKNNPVEVPGEVAEATRHAYAGGRFQLFKCGLFLGPVYSIDLNSAYVAAMRYLPRLDKGCWSRLAPELARSCIQDFALYNIRYSDSEGWFARFPHPLYRRRSDGRVDFPAEVTGWYWGPEARLVADDPRAEFLDAWVWDNDEPAFDWVADMYDERLRLKKAGKLAEQRTYKWGLASMYGACAQQSGWSRTGGPPRTHQLEWAGFITSWCRAKMWTAAMPHAKTDGLVSIATDGITSLTPFTDSVNSSILGQWEHSQHSGILQWQNGVYWLLNADGEWVPKNRGLKRGSVKEEVRKLAESAILEMEAKGTWNEQRQHAGEAGRVGHQPVGRDTGRAAFFIDKRECSIPIRQQNYIGYRAAAQFTQWERWRQWETTSRDNLLGGGNHHPGGCRRCRGEDHPMHDCLQASTDIDPISRPYRLGWLDPPEGYLDPEGAEVNDWATQQYVGIHHDDDLGEW